MESIDALAKAVNEFEGGMVLVSHDMRLIGQVAKEIWICDNKTIEKYKGDILNFKMEMRAQMGIGELRGDASTRAKEGAEEKKEAPKKAPEPKLEVVAPKPKTPAVVVDLGQVATAPTSTTTTVAAAASSAASSASPSNLPASEPEAGKGSAAPEDPPKNRYVPPHLRRKMQQQGSL
jgi:ATP-binding cassette subfamily F protein 2